MYLAFKLMTNYWQVLNDKKLFVNAYKQRLSPAPTCGYMRQWNARTRLKWSAWPTFCVRFTKSSWIPSSSRSESVAARSASRRGSKALAMTWNCTTSRTNLHIFAELKRKKSVIILSLKYLQMRVWEAEWECTFPGEWRSHERSRISFPVPCLLRERIRFLPLLWNFQKWKLNHERFRSLSHPASRLCSKNWN